MRLDGWFLAGALFGCVLPLLVLPVALLSAGALAGFGAAASVLFALAALAWLGAALPVRPPARLAAPIAGVLIAGAFGSAALAVALACAPFMARPNGFDAALLLLTLAPALVYVRTAWRLRGAAVSRRAALLGCAVALGLAGGVHAAVRQVAERAWNALAADEAAERARGAALLQRFGGFGSTALLLERWSQGGGSRGADPSLERISEALRPVLGASARECARSGEPPFELPQ